MTETIYYFQKGLLLVVLLSLPPLLIAVAVGVIVSLLQTALSVQDQALPFACKLVAVGITLVVTGRWLGVELLSLTEQAFRDIATLAHGSR